MITIYLVGQISKEAPETYTWRENVERYFSIKNMDIKIINPCNTNFNRAIFADEKSPYCYEGVDILPSKDFNHVKESDIGIANLNIYDPDKPIVGSCFELAWYYTFPGKTVIGICNQDNRMIQSPFIKQAVNTWVKTEEEACDYVDFYFGGIR